jgi:hypothetical protein
MGQLCEIAGIEYKATKKKRVPEQQALDLGQSTHVAAIKL